MWATVLLRLITASALSIFLWRAWMVWQSEPSLTLFLLALGEIVTIVIYLSARPSISVSYRPVATISTIAATFFFLFVALGGGAKLVPYVATVSMQVLGITWQIWSKINLGRSFGLLPANRGIVTKGPYRLVRHPIYLGYLLSHLGFLMANFSLRNCLLLTSLAFFQILRISEEEKLLSKDEAYEAYRSVTRYRLIPGLY